MSSNGQNDSLSFDVVRKETNFCVNESIDSLSPMFSCVTTNRLEAAKSMPWDYNPASDVYAQIFRGR